MSCKTYKKIQISLIIDGVLSGGTWTKNVGGQIRFVIYNFFLEEKLFIFSLHFLSLKQTHIIVEFKKILLSFAIISCYYIIIPN